MKDNIVISGFGTVTPCGAGNLAFEQGLFSGERHFADFENKYIDTCHVKMACLINRTKLNPEESVSFSMLDNAIKETLFLAGGIDLTTRTALIVGSGLGNIDQIEHDLFYNNGNLSQESLYGMNSIALKIAHKYNITGQVTTLSTGCSSTNYAIAYASDIIELGKYDRVICCGFELFSILVANCFNKMNGADPDGIKPFDKNRAGSSVGEGAGVLIIEKESDVLKRKILPIAVVCGYGLSCEAYNSIVPEPDGKQAILAMNKAMNKAGIKPAMISLLLAHATGTKLNDVFEAHCVNEVFGEYSKELPVTALKSVIGHTGGSSNILAVCAGIICLNNKRAFKTLGTKDVSEDCKIRLLLNHTKIHGNYIMINGFAFGGNNASIIIKSYTGSTT